MVEIHIQASWWQICVFFTIHWCIIKIYSLMAGRIVTNRPFCGFLHSDSNTIVWTTFSDLFFFHLFHLQGSACSLLRQAWATPPGSAWSVSARLLRPTRCDCWPSSVGPRPRSSTTSAWLWCCPPKIVRSPSLPRRSCCRPTVSTAFILLGCLFLMQCI